MDGMGFGRPLDFEPMLKHSGFHRDGLERTDPPYGRGPGGGKSKKYMGSSAQRFPSRDIEVAFGTIKAWTRGAVCTRAAGVVGGREAIVIVHIIRMARDVAP